MKAFQIGLDAQEARDITGIEPVSLPSDNAGALWPWLLVGLLLFGLAWWIGRRWRRSSAKPGLSPRERALMQIDRLVARGLHQDGRQHRFLGLLSLIIRHYLQRTLDLPARRRTSRELLAMLEEKAVLDNDQMRGLRTFLDQSDKARFAPEAISPQECEEMAAHARALTCSPGLARGNRPTMLEKDVPAKDAAFPGQARG